MSTASGTKRPLPEEDTESVLVPAVRRRRPSPILQQSMLETAVSNDSPQKDTSDASEKGTQKTKQKRLPAPWTEEEDKLLREAVLTYGTAAGWHLIAECLPGRSQSQCIRRWESAMKPMPGVSPKRPWTKEEDDLISELVKMHGPKRWSLISSSLPGRTPKQCRERWHNHLHPDINKSAAWTEEEDRVILESHQKEGNKWAAMAKKLSGRTDNAIKNRWNSSIKRKAAAYLANKQGVPVAELRYLDDGRFDFGGDIEGVLAAVRKKKVKPAKYNPPKKPRKPKEPKAKAVKKEPKPSKPKKLKAVKSKVMSPNKLKNSPSRSALKAAFVRKDRVTMTWSPRGFNTNEAEPSSDVKGASLLMSLASSSETVSPFVKPASAAASTASPSKQPAPAPTSPFEKPAAASMPSFKEPAAALESPFRMPAAAAPMSSPFRIQTVAAPMPPFAANNSLSSEEVVDAILLQAYASRIARIREALLY